MNVVAEQVHNGRWQVVEYTEDGFAVLWEGTDGRYAERRAVEEQILADRDVEDTEEERD